MVQIAETGKRIDGELSRDSNSNLKPPAAASRRTVVQVLHLIPRSKRSMELFLLALTETLGGKGWRTVHVFSAEPEQDWFRKELERLNSPYLIARFPLTWRDAWKLGRRLRQYHPDVLQTHFISHFSQSLPVLKIASQAKHLIITDHSSGQASPKSPMKRLLARLRGAFASQYINQSVAVSNFVRDREIRDVHLPRAKVKTIYNGVDIAKFVPAPFPKNQVFTVGFLGQLIPEKGVLTLLRSIKELKEEGAPPLRVRIAGQGDQKEDLRQFCRRNGLSEVEFLGQIDWVPRFLSSVDLVVIPSEWEEAFGFSVLEALACGACVLGSDAGAIPEVVGTNGEAGVIFRKGDAEDLKRKLRGLIDSPDHREQMRRAGRERAVSHFSIQRMVEGYASIFDELDGGLG